jgi:hypothetical protein
MSEQTDDRDTKIIAVGKPSQLLGQRAKNDREKAWEAVAGRDKYDQRMNAVDLLFSVGGLKKLGFGDKTIAGLVSSGALAYWQGYIKSTVGAGGMGDRTYISPENEKWLSYGLAKYQRFREERSVRNEYDHPVDCKKAGLCGMLGHPFYCKGQTYQPGQTMLDGQDSPYVKGLALKVLQVLAHQICKSFNKADSQTTVLAPEEQKWPVDPRTGRPMMPFGQQEYPTDNLQRQRRPSAVENVETEPVE